MTELYDGATHKIDDQYFAKDYIGRWCYIAENGEVWPAHSIERYAVPIEKEINK